MIKKKTFCLGANCVPGPPRVPKLSRGECVNVQVRKVPELEQPGVWGLHRGGGSTPWREGRTCREMSLSTSLVGRTGSPRGVYAGEGRGRLCLTLHRPREDQRGQNVVEPGQQQNRDGGRGRRGERAEGRGTHRYIYLFFSFGATPSQHVGS